jgi:pyridoxal phosphate enzyme (YggS family)
VTVSNRLSEVRARIEAAARAAGRAPDAVELVVVTKAATVRQTQDAWNAGARDFGENRAQDLVSKAEAWGHDAAREESGEKPRWHFIGRLQRNKVKAVAPYVSLWQSVDREELAVEISRKARETNVLVQVSLAGEEQKGGCLPHELDRLVDRCRETGCSVRGLMTIPPAAGDPRPVFARLRALADTAGLPVCSMGMSGDFEAAIAEGSTMVRVGSAIFAQ